MVQVMIAGLFVVCVIRAQDPIFTLATPLLPEEEDSHNREVITLECRPQEDLGEAERHAAETKVVQGGWFGRGYGKGRRKKKKKYN